jgi:hypothetical protein
MSWYELNLAHLAPLWARGGEGKRTGRFLEIRVYVLPPFTFIF